MTNPRVPDPKAPAVDPKNIPASRLREEIAEARTENSNLSTQLRDSQNTINTLRTEAAQAKIAMDNLRRDSTNADPAEVAKLRTEVEDSHGTIRNLRSEISNHQTVISNLRTDASRHQTRIRELENAAPAVAREEYLPPVAIEVVSVTKTPHPDGGENLRVVARRAGTRDEPETFSFGPDVEITEIQATDSVRDHFRAAQER